MKKLIIALSAFVLAACNNNDETPEAPQNSALIGVWKIQSKTMISGADQTTAIGQETIDDCKKQSTYEFRTDGKYDMNDFNSIGSSCQKFAATVEYTYTPAEQKLVINGNAAKVLELTASKLVLQVPDNYDYNSDGKNDYVKYTYYK